MKNSTQTSLLTIFAIFTLVFSSNAQSKERQFYQLKTYFLKDGNQEKAIDTYLKEAYLPALKRIGIAHIGVFKTRAEKENTESKIYVLLPFTSIEQFLNLDVMLAQDKSYISSGSDYINAKHDNAPYERISSTLMKAFIEMPIMQASKLKGPRKERVYELRSYESATEAIYLNKVDMFNIGGEVELFDSLGFNAVFYAEVISGDRMPNLMYMTTFKNMESRDAHWASFNTAEKWQELIADPNYQNNVSKANIMLLYPTEYSDY